VRFAEVRCKSLILLAEVNFRGGCAELRKSPCKLLILLAEVEVRKLRKLRSPTGRLALLRSRLQGSPPPTLRKGQKWNT
jgi:hypothetical protein